MTPTQQVEGVVEALNANGLRLAGTSSWLNVSRFHPVPLPPAGAYVRVDIDAKGYIRELEVLDKGSLADTTTGRQSREHVISRLAVLKAAALFGASRPDLKSSDVLKIADLWLAWVGDR